MTGQGLMRIERNTVAICFGILLAGAVNVPAVLFKSTGDPDHNTNAPTGYLTNSGWQYEGDWSSYLGTTIAPRYFVAAKHVGGSIGQPFVLNGFSYMTITNFPNPNSDLVIWKVAETFPIYAPLYTNSNEVGQHCVVFGRGTQRGTPVILDKTNGWRWGSTDGVKRWGENDVGTIVAGGAGFGDLLKANFNRNGGSNECHLSVGDSSGAMFITNGGAWKLAGIHYSVDGYFSFTGSDTDRFDGAMMDVGGFYVGSDAHGWTFYPNQVTDIPSGFYSTRISANLAWINSVIDFLPGDDLQFTSIETVGNDVSISFATGLNRRYYVEHIDDLPSGAWTIFTNNVPGTGGIVTVIDANAAILSNRFYRLGLVP
jgi:hypothetical protein